MLNFFACKSLLLLWSVGCSYDYMKQDKLNETNGIFETVSSPSQSRSISQSYGGLLSSVSWVNAVLCRLNVSDRHQTQYFLKLHLLYTDVSIKPAAVWCLTVREDQGYTYTRFCLDTGNVPAIHHMLPDLPVCCLSFSPRMDPQHTNASLHTLTHTHTSNSSSNTCNAFCLDKYVPVV